MMKRIGELNKEVTNLKSEADRFKAEVERLTAFTTRTIIPNEELQAQVERLTNAGDAMASSIQFNEEMAQDYNGPTIVHQSVQRWREAKEGKQP
jgi:outer membrane murein-binding lipoprotein Lpp